MFKPKPRQSKERPPLTIRLTIEEIGELKSWAEQEKIRPAQLAAQIIEHVLSERRERGK